MNTTQPNIWHNFFYIEVVCIVLILQIALNEIASIQFLGAVCTMKAKPAPISQKLKPTIIILSKD